jgi:peptidoglycan/xylan/chitin deacetylase (PgdA/CDA1 family)
MRSFKADLLAATFIAAAVAPFAIVSARAEPGAPVAPVSSQATLPQAAMQLAVQNNTPLPAESAPVPVQADAPAHPQDTTPAASAKPDAAAAPAPDSKQQDSGKDGKPDSAAPVQAQSPAPVQATAQNNCPGNPNALGTSRVLAIDPADFKRLGHMQYPDSLPLQDKEVVITFDDGPLPPYSNQILDILAAECVKVTYFLVGEMARAYPAVVRREYEAGHTLGTHSEHHPLHFGELPLDRMRSEIDVGISDVAAALGDTKYLAPFFRIPGLDRSNTLEDELAARHLIVFSSDTVADDWRHVTPEQIKSLALSRLMKLGKGILLLHDIHPKTVAALPGILKGLKDNGFRIVQVVPSASYQIAMANKPKTPILASATPDELKIGGGIDNAGAQPAWPQPAALSDSLKPGDVALPAPDASSFQPDSGMPDDSASVQWPEQPKATASSDEDAHGDKSSEHERHRKHDADSDEHGRHHRRHQRARSSEGHRADLVSNIKSLAGMFTPAH